MFAVMNDFAKYIGFAFRLVSKPEEYRKEITAKTAEGENKVHYILVLPVLLLSCLVAGYHYYSIDGLFPGILIYGVTFVIELMIAGIIILTCKLLLKQNGIIPAVTLYNLAYVLFWLFTGELICNIALASLDIIGTIVVLVVKLGSVWLANLVLNEILFATVPLEIKKLKTVSNLMTLTLVLVGLIFPYLLSKIPEWILLKSFV
jgi:hypothetical protein